MASSSPTGTGRRGRDGAARLVQPRPVRAARVRRELRDLAGVSALFPSLARLGLARFGVGPTGLPPDAQEREHARDSSASDLRGQRDEWSQLPDLFAQAQGLTDLGRTPLVVVTAGEQEPDRFAAQDRPAALSTDSDHRVLDGAAHADLLHDEAFAADSARAVLDVVHAVRAGTPLRPAPVRAP